jgi:hypothetical protein
MVSAGTTSGIARLRRSSRSAWARATCWARDWPGLFERQAIAGTVDDEEYVAAFDRLVVDDMHFADQARDIGRDRHGIGAHLAVAGYRFDLVADPEAIARRADKEDHEHW